MPLTATAGFAWLNHVCFGLPHTIGLMVMGLVSSLLLIAGELLVPEVHLYEELTSIIRHIDFQRFVLEGMLAFLLFAGALHVDFSRLRKRSHSVGTMATLGVAISTLIIGTLLWLLAPTYCAVIFTIAVQGLTLTRVIRRYCEGSSKPSCERRIL